MMKHQMTNYEVIKQMPLESFANLVYTIATRDCETLQEFETILRKEFPKEGERALQNVLNQKLENLAEPLIEHLKENYHPHTSIIITEDGVAVMETILSIPEKVINHSTL